MQGKKVLLIDADSQGSLTASLGYAETFRYALDKLKESGIGRSVGNEKNYIITVLYNASDTIDFHFRAMVNHDMYGDGLAERGINIQ